MDRKPQARQLLAHRGRNRRPYRPLQGIEDPLERRRRAVEHGRRALDALDELKLALLSGTLEASALLRLKAVAGDLKDGSGDEKLDHALGKIQLRVAVELVKAGIDSV